jgi:hypothetical protein
MPLTDQSKHLLREIYQVPYTDTTVISGGFGSNSSTSSAFDFQLGVRQQLEKAIAGIDADETMVKRVEAILAEYQQIALDRSNINREGYEFKASRNLRAIFSSLYSYTGIMMRQGRQSNRLPLG